MEFYISGVIAYSTDPSNIYLENIYIEATNVLRGFTFPVVWNYPEAHLSPVVDVQNLTAEMPSDSDPNLSTIFQYSGPGNVSLSDIDISNTFTKGTSGVTLSLFYTSLCVPDDGPSVTQTFSLNRIKTSLKDNNFATKSNMISIDFTASLSRINNLTVTGIEIEDFKYTGLPSIAMRATLTDHLSFTDLDFSQYATFISPIIIGYWGKIH